MSVRSITAMNVNYAFIDGLHWLAAAGVREDSRNGPVLVAPGPVATTYLNPRERVLFEPRRNANPVFHLMESIWMLAGRNDVDWLEPFNRQMLAYAEPNGLQHGAYGYRWRKHFTYDQIGRLIEELKANKGSRRAVLAMWDPLVDQYQPVKDVPCNTHIYFDVRGGKLNMTVCNRSNDILWGAYGANVVHMSILQELIAHELDAEVGSYTQFSNNFHIYTELPMASELLATLPTEPHDRYGSGEALAMPLLAVDENWKDFVDDCERLCDLQAADWGAVQWYTDFFRILAFPLYKIYLRRKAGIDVTAMVEKLPQNVDWVVAFREWMARKAAA